MTRDDASTLKNHIVRLYYERYTCHEIAVLTGLTYRYVRDTLKERGITPGSRAGRTNERARRRAKMREMGGQT